MKSTPRLALLFVMVATVLFTTVPRTSAQSSETLAEYVPNEIIVTLHAGHTLTASGRLLNRQGGQELSRLHPGMLSADLLGSSGDVALLKMAPGSTMTAQLEALRANPAVRSADPNYIRTSMVAPNDPQFGGQWGLQRIEAPAAWDITIGAPVMIAMIDTGVSGSHEEFQGKIVGGYNAITGGGNANDDNGHGTHTAGIAAASSNNGLGVAGVCWGCTLLPIKVLNRFGQGTTAAIIRGIRYAADAGARVANMSLGGPEFVQAEKDAVDYAYSKGTLIVAASGNSGNRGNPKIYPSSFDNVLAVGATNSNDKIANFSTYGSYLDVSAPGVDVLSTIWDPEHGNSYARADGTSMAAPHVAGLAGQILSIWPELSVDQLRQLIMATADDLGEPGRDDYFGYGRINARRALEATRDRNIPRLPGQTSLNPAFARVGPSGDPNVTFFPETGHTLRGMFKDYWHQNGGLPVFGFAISEEFIEQTPEGNFLVQYFERERFELHLEKAPPYHVLLGRLGDQVLLDQGRSWFTFPKGTQTSGCLWFGDTGHSICEPFLGYWRSHGLQFDSDPNTSGAEALALFGAPLSEPNWETNKSGDTVLTQWYERARLELHPNKPAEFQIQLGLLANELVDGRGWR